MRFAGRSTLLCVAFLVAGLVLLWLVFVPQATQGAAFPYPFAAWDYHNYFLPRYVYGTQELLAGRLPLWNPLEFTGLPFLATLQPAALHPLKNAAFALLSPGTAMQVLLAAHQLLFAGGFLFFARGQGLGALGAAAGAAFLAFDAAIFASDHHPFRILSLAWLPWIFALADRAARARRRAPSAALAAIVALQLLAGYPEFTLQAAIVLALHAIVMHALGLWPDPPWRTLPPLALAFGLGALCAGVELVPFVELAFASGRTQAAAAFAAQGPEALVGAPNALQVLFLALAMFPSLVVFFPAALRQRRVLPALAGTVFVAMMGGGGWRLLRMLPGFTGLRHGLIWTFTALFFSAWVIALGTDAFSRRSGNAWRDRFDAASVGALCVLVLVVCALAQGLGVLRGAPGPLTQGALPSSLSAAGAALLLAAGCLARPSRRRDALVAAGLAAAVAGQIAAYPVFGAASPFAPAQPPERLATLLPAGAPPPSGRVFSFHDLRWGQTFYERIASPFGLETSLPPERVRALEARLGFEANWHRIDWAAFGAADGFADAVDLELTVVPRLVLNALPEASWERLPVGDTSHAVVRNRERPGRAWVVYGASIVTPPAAALERLLAPGFDPRREAILEVTPAHRYAEPAAAAPASAASVRTVSPTRVEVEAELARPGILILSEAWFPGWRASVGGVPAPILRADYLLRGVELAAGRHHVRFDYRPWSVAIGAGMSLLGVIGCATLALHGRRRGAPGSAT